MTKQQDAALLRYLRETTRLGPTPFRYVITAEDVQRGFRPLTVQVRNAYHETDEYHVAISERIVSSIRPCEGPVPLRLRRPMAEGTCITVVRAARTPYKDEGAAIIRFERKEDLQ